MNTASRFGANKCNWNRTIPFLCLNWMKRYFDISVSRSHLRKKLIWGLFSSFSQYWVSSISLLDFWFHSPPECMRVCTCARTHTWTHTHTCTHSFHFPLKPPTWHRLRFSNPHTCHSPSMAASLRNRERDSEPSLPREESEQPRSQSLGFARKMALPQLCTEQPSRGGQCTSAWQNLLGFEAKALRKTLSREQGRGRQ